MGYILSIVCRIISLAILVCAAPSHAQPGEFSHQELGITMRIPDGWKPIAQKTLEASAHQKDLAENGAVLAGYARGGAGLTPPYMVIDAWTPPFDYTRATWNDLVTHLDLTLIEDARTNGMLDGNGKYTGSDLSPGILDKDRKMILMQGPLPKNSRTGRQLYLVSASFLGKFDFVRVHAYLPVDRVKSLMPEVLMTLDSAKFEQGAGYQPFTPKSSPRIGRRRYGRIGGLGFGGVGLMVGIWYVFRRLSDD
ncbi:MAG: hypothetical protein IT438_07880 [Phycisphaerales bacterium]|nr:hypothetical protein [Phycisphaerales bacterium]